MTFLRFGSMARTVSLNLLGISMISTQSSNLRIILLGTLNFWMSLFQDWVGIRTDLFVKKTHQYLDFSSCHYLSHQKGYHLQADSLYQEDRLRLGSFRQARYFSSPNNVFEDRCSESWLRKRGYPDGMIDEQIDQAKNIDRTELLDIEKIISEIIQSFHATLPLPLPFCSLMLNIVGILRNFLRSLMLGGGVFKCEIGVHQQVHLP